MSKVPLTHLLYKDVNGKPELCVSYSQLDTFVQCPYKWYKTYIEGSRSDTKTEALAYGTVIHRTLEYFFKNGCQPRGEDLSRAINLYAYEEQIPFNSIEDQLLAMRQSGELIAWILDLFSRDTRRQFIKPDSELNRFEQLLRRGKILGVEEDFVLPYKLPKPVDINGRIHTHVYIIGSVDLHLGIKKNGVMNHYVIDWKSGKKIFDKHKLDTNLQHPIYSFYIMRKYCEGLPRMNLYLFTRTREYQMVKVDEERKKSAILDINDYFSKMYDFETPSVSGYTGFVEKEDKSGFTRKKFWMNPTTENKKPCPSALCYYCDFGIHGEKKGCPYSSSWDPSKKKTK